LNDWKGAAVLDPLPSYTIQIRALDPTRADIRIQFAELPPDVEIHGRLMGPRCPGVNTVEVAYPLQATDAAGIYRVLIPEPNFWTPERPFRYEGPVEFWQHGKLVGRSLVSVGLRLGNAEAS
jgi:hypothetical protein